MIIEGGLGDMITLRSEAVNDEASCLFAQSRCVLGLVRCVEGPLAVLIIYFVWVMCVASIAQAGKLAQRWQICEPRDELLLARTEHAILVNHCLPAWAACKLFPGWDFPQL